MFKKKMKVKKFVTRTSSVSKVQGAMRSLFVRAIHKALKDGTWKSKVLCLFEVEDIITTKCFVVVPKREIALDANSQKVKLLMKTLKRSEIENFCKTTTPSESAVNGIIDNWIFMTPGTPHIVRAFAIYRDGGASSSTDSYMQLTQYCEGYENVYTKLAGMKLRNLNNDGIPFQLHKFIFNFIIQMAHSFEYAHQSDLTHGQFDLTQVVVNEDCDDFKLVNLRPWLVTGRQFSQLEDQTMMDGHKERLAYAKSMDLYNFGVAVFEMMVGKDSEHMIIQRPEELLPQFDLPPDKKQFKEPQSMPYLDSIPMSWVKLPQISCLLQILHIGMLVETQRNTAQMFRQIRLLATEAFKRHYDQNFVGPCEVSQVNPIAVKKVLSAAYNNRAVLIGPKLDQVSVNKRVNKDQNDDIVGLQMENFTQACEIDPTCCEAQINRLIVQWKQGEIFDETFCDLVKKHVQTKLTAQLMIMTFRKTIGLPIIGAEERKLTYCREAVGKGKNKPDTGLNWGNQQNKKSVMLTPLQQRLLKKYLDYTSNEQDLGQNMFSHLTSIIPTPETNASKYAQPVKQKQTTMSSLMNFMNPLTSATESTNKQKPPNTKPVLEPSLQVKKIFFSKNEQFLCLITENQAVVVQINNQSFEHKASVDLPISPPAELEEQEPAKIGSEHETITSENSQLMESPRDSLQEENSHEGNLQAGSRGSQSQSEDDEAESQNKLENEKLRKEKQRERIKKFSLGSGHFSSDWVAAIDDKGQRLALHDMSKTHSRIWNYTNVDDKPYMSLAIEVHVYSGLKLDSYYNIQLGNILKDEIFEMFFDDDKVQRVEYSEQHSRGMSPEQMIREEEQHVVSQTDDDMSISNNTPREEVMSTQGVLSSREYGKKVDFKLELGGIENNEIYSNRQDQVNSPWDSHFGTEEFVTTRILPDSINSPKDLLARSLHGSRVRPTAKRFSKNQPRQVIIFHCKDLFSYEVDISDEIYSDNAPVMDSMKSNHNLTKPGYNLSLVREPERLISGATLPMSIFREHTDHNEVECGKLGLDHSKLSEKTASRIKRKVKENLTSQMFSQRVDQECAYGGFRTQHFEHIKEFIEEQELQGNLVKLPRYSNNYLVVYQSQRCAKYEPHFYVYDIVKRCVTRRFLPLSQDFSLHWNEDAIEIDNYKKQKKEAKRNRDEDQDSSSSHELQDNQDVSSFEVSPRGTFLVAVMPDSEMFSLKYLPEGAIHDFRDSIEPFYYTEIDEQYFLEQTGKLLTTPNSDESCSDRDSDEKYYNTTESYYSKMGLAYKLARLYQRTVTFTGGNEERHRILYSYYKTMGQALKEPRKLFTKTLSRMETAFARKITMHALGQLKDLEGQKMDGAIVINEQPTSPRTISKSFSAIRHFNQHFSVMTSYASGTPVGQFINDFSEKTKLKGLKKISLFDQIAFGRAEDKIRFFTIGTMPASNYIALFFRRNIQIYDMSTADQILEAYLPMCKSLKFMNQDTILVAQDGDSQVFICATESQRNVFRNKGTTQIGSKDVTFTDEDKNSKGIGQYTIGIEKQRRIKNNQAALQDAFENESEEVVEQAVKSTKAIEVIRNDEDILQMEMTKNIANYAYISLIDNVKLTIFLIMQDDNSISYDTVLVWQFWQLRKGKIGSKITQMAFTDSCEEFVALTNNYSIVLFSITKAPEYMVIYKLANVYRPINILESVGAHCTHVITASHENTNILIIKNLHNQVDNSWKTGVQPVATPQLTEVNFSDGKFETLGKLTSLQVDNSDQYIICTFDNDKLGLFQISSGTLLQTVDSMQGVNFSYVQIDDLCGFMGCLDASRTFVHLLVFDWAYNFKKPQKPLGKQDNKKGILTKKDLRKKNQTTPKNKESRDFFLHKQDTWRQREEPVNEDGTPQKQSSVCNIF